MAIVKKGIMQTDAPARITNGISSRLRTRWWAAAGLCFFALGGEFFLIKPGHSRPDAWQSMLQSLIIMIYVLGLQKYGLRWNYHPIEKVLRSTLGYGTWLTIIRGILLAVLAGYLFQPWPASDFFPGRLSWTPGLLYITGLGVFLDINLDALGLLIASLAAVWYGQLPPAYLSAGFVYYAFIGGIWLRKKFSKPVFELQPWRGARIIAGFQMGLVGIALLPILKPPVTTLTAYGAMLLLLAGFVRDWMIVCGYLNPK
ncbi:MAG: hypothetical protein P8X90_26740 [Desulfobacterales bacterium]